MRKVFTKTKDVIVCPLDNRTTEQQDKGIMGPSNQSNWTVVQPRLSQLATAWLLGNGERRRKWRKNEEMEREGGSREREQDCPDYV